MRTQRTIGTARCECDTKVCTAPAKRLVIDNHILDDIPLGKKIKLIIEEEIQHRCRNLRTKRKLVVPEGVLWRRNFMRPAKEGAEYWLSVKDGGLLGFVREDGNKYFWKAGCDDTYGGWRTTRGEADRAVYETFANLNQHGFSWKTIEPDWSRYECVTAWRRCTESNIRWQWERRNFPNHIDKEILYDYFQNSKYLSDVNMAIIEGRLPDGSMEIIDRWERSEEEKGK